MAGALGASAVPAPRLVWLIAGSAILFSVSLAAWMSLGFWRACPPMPMVGSGSFGHPGSGGSLGFADPDARVGFGYVTNLWSWNTAEPRASSLAAAVRDWLG